MTTSTATSSTELYRPRQTRMIQNFYVAWLDENIDENDDDSHNFITNLRQIVSSVNAFKNVDECVDFITDITDEKAFIIVSESLSYNIVSISEDISQIRSIHIFSENESLFNKLKNLSFKVKSVSKDMVSICKVLQKACKHYDYNTMSISFIKPTTTFSKYNLDTLDCSFMYTQLLKEILVTIEFSHHQFTDFLNYCREKFVDNKPDLIKIEKIEKEYHCHRPIWWYTYNTFLYSILNRALRLMDVDIILKMGFFVSDLHKDIAVLHSEQDYLNSFVVYRGQGLSHTDFNQLKKTQGGLLAFNNFLSISYDHAVAYRFADSNRDDPDLIGVLFQITINSSTPSSPFANITDISHFQEEEEILFSMSSIFRIGQIMPLDESLRLWQVELTLTSDEDPQLRDLSENIREETCSGSDGWDRLCLLMIQLGQYDKAEELCELLLRQANRSEEKSYLFNLLGCIKDGQGIYEQAVQYYKKAVEIQNNILPENHRPLASYYNNIGHVYTNMGEYSNALEYYHKSLEIKKANSAIDSDFALSYNNIGMVYNYMGDYLKARKYYGKALSIQQKILPTYHPNLASSYNNIGFTRNNMGEHTEALEFYQRALNIYQKSLPTNHPHFVTSYNNIGAVFAKMGNYSKALEYYQKALDICQKTLSASHSNLAFSYNNIGSLYAKLCDYSKAIGFYCKSLEILRKGLPRNHLSLATSYNNIGAVYDEMGKYTKSLEYYEKAVEIYQNSDAANHPDMGNAYNNIAIVYDKIGEPSKALDHYLKALEIYRKTLPEDHPSLISYYINISMLYNRKGQYPKALEILEKTLHRNNPSLAISYNNIGEVYQRMGEYSLALDYHTKALEIQKTLPSNPSLLATSYNNIGLVYDLVRDYSKAFFYYEEALKIRLEILPSNHPSLAVSYSNIANIYYSNKDYSNALKYFERALNIKRLSLPPNHPTIKTVEERIEIVRKNL